MGRDENVSMEILGRLCKYFKCDISDILEYRSENLHKNSILVCNYGI